MQSIDEMIAAVGLECDRVDDAEYRSRLREIRRFLNCHETRQMTGSDIQRLRPLAARLVELGDLPEEMLKPLSFSN